MPGCGWNIRDESKYYADYLRGQITWADLYATVPDKQIHSVINRGIGETILSKIFARIDQQLGNKKLDLIIGGPPCQAYSVVGRARDSKRMKGDSRNYLFRYYAEFLKRYKPLYFVLENVMGLLSARDKDGTSHLDNMCRLFREIGYETEFMALSAEDYGVLQRRKRIFLLGRQGTLTDFYPEPEKWNPGVCVKEALADLPPLKAGDGDARKARMKPYRGSWLHETGIKNNAIPVTLHQARPNTEQDLEIYWLAVDLWNQEKRRFDYNMLPDHLKTHRNRDAFTDRFKVVAAELPYSHTVVAHIAKDGHHYIHPDIDQNRSITPREAARLQTFPDDYYFESASGVPSRTAAFRQIGNAVPVLMAERIARKLMEMW